MLLLLTGLLPFPAGFLQNYCMTTLFRETALPYGAIGFTSLAVWLLLGALLYPLAKSVTRAAVPANLPALAVLLLILFQELVLHRYWPNFLGVATQLFYLPVLGIAVKLHRFSSMASAYTAAFLLMYGAFYLGCTLRNKYLSRA